MDNENIEMKRSTAETAEAEEVKAAAGTGKFESVDALLTAYRNLEAEFTRRSQRLKELECGNKAQDMPEAGAPSHESGLDGDGLLRAALSSEEVKKAVIEDYLKSLAAGKSVPLISGGVSSATPRQTPKSIKEAGALAKQFLKN